jgi:hypothetical protein
MGRIGIAVLKVHMCKMDPFHTVVVPPEEKSGRIPRKHRSEARILLSEQLADVLGSLDISLIRGVSGLKSPSLWAQIPHVNISAPAMRRLVNRVRLTC